MKKTVIILISLLSLLYNQIPERRIVAEWEPALGTMIRWPLGIPSDLVVELASENILYVLVETNNQQNQASNSFNNWGVDIDNVYLLIQILIAIGQEIMVLNFLLEMITGGSLIRILMVTP